MNSQPVDVPDLTTPARPAGRRVVFLVLAGVVLVGLAGLVYVVVSNGKAPTTSHSASHTEVAAPVVSLVADGDIRVTLGGDTTEVAVTADGRWGSRAPTYTATTTDGRLEIKHTCPSGLASCQAGLQVVVPPGTALVVRSSSGDVQVSSDSDVDARSDSGDVHVSGGTSAKAGSSSGAVVVEGVSGDVDATSSSGDVTVHGTGVPVALDISTSGGEQTVDAPTDPTATTRVTISSDSGDVSFLGAGH